MSLHSASNQRLEQSGLRPVWLASYPRSGNTYLRIVLETIFGLPSFSLYNLERQDYEDPSAVALTQAPRLPLNWRDLVSSAGDAPLTPIKTHGPPPDDGPAVYVIRDGQAALHSYFHYHQKFSFEKPTLTEVIAGACQFGGWSEHYLAWRPRQRPKTLFLRYEELVARPEESIAQLAGFLGQEPLARELPTFDDLQGRFPAFFRRGINQDFLTEWTPGQAALFNELHGAVMSELGYSLRPVQGSDTGTVVELARSAARLHALYLEQLAKVGAAWTAQQESTEAATQLAEQVQMVSRQLAEREEALKDLRKSWWVKLGKAIGVLNRGPGSGRAAREKCGLSPIGISSTQRQP